MSWIEEQTWFGLEPDDLDSLMRFYEEECRDLLLAHGVWVTKDRKRVKLEEMETSHIENCINKCKRDNWRLWALPKLSQEFNKRTLCG